MNAQLPQLHSFRYSVLTVCVPSLVFLLFLAALMAPSSAQAHPQSTTPSRAVAATEAISTTLYLPLVAQTEVQTVTVVSTAAQWTADWWEWIESVNSVPLFQEGAVDCGLGQSGDIWFLAGTDGSGPMARQCTVPPKKTFVIPIHTAAWANEGAEDLTVEEKRDVLDAVYSDEEAGLLNSEICRVEAAVNGEDVENTRLQSPPFSRLGDTEAVADGYWFAVKLPPGTHEVSFRGTLCEFGTDTPMNDVDVTYTITVEEP